MGGNIILLEEFFYISEETFLEAITPILALAVVALIAISTLGAEPKAYQYDLINGPNAFFECEFVTYVCNPCREKGIQDSCKHNLDAIPHWSSEGRVDRIRRIFGEKHKDKFMRESVGIVTFSDNIVFDPTKIRAFISAPRVRLERNVLYIYVSIDPCAGSEVSATRLSDFAMVAISDPGTTILGLDAFEVNHPDDYFERLVFFLKLLRSHPRTKNAKLVIDAEAGTGLEAGHINKLIADKIGENIIYMHDFKNSKQGTKTLHENKQEMCLLTQTEINLQQMDIWENLICTHPNKAETVDLLKTQLLSYERITRPGKDPFTATKAILTGKGTNKRARDDLGLTLQRAIYTRKRFKYDNAYARYR